MIFSSTLDAHNTGQEPLPLYKSNGFFVSYYTNEIFDIGELQMRRRAYGCDVEVLNGGLTLCDTTWVIEWWGVGDTVSLDIASVIEDFENIPEVTVTPNYLYSANGSPDDPVINVQTPFAIPNDTLFPVQWHMQEEHINMPYAWGRTRGCSDVLIGILDTGVWFDHEDLQENLWINPGEDLNGDGEIQPEELNGLDDDGNGYPDDFCGWDWVDYDNDARHPIDDVSFHGTKVAGVASATTNNFIGVAGTGWDCSYVPLRAGSQQGLYLEYIVPAMLYAIQEGIDILNCSWYNFYDNYILDKLTECLFDEGTVVVACAGNNGMNLPAYPACYDWVVAVAATDQDKTLASFSNYGDWIHLAAPGVSILTTSTYEDSMMLHSCYNYKDGTSFSAPMVSAAAALIWSIRPHWGPGQVISRLYNTTEPMADQDDPPIRVIAGGILNVYNAVNMPPGGIEPETAMP
jgi:subtilisin family serine protease